MPILGEHAPPIHKPAGPTPPPFLTPTVRGQIVELLGGGYPGRSRSSRHPEASAGQPAPSSSARFLPRCAGARSQTLRRWAARGTYQRPPPPPNPRSGFAQLGPEPIVRGHSPDAATNQMWRPGRRRVNRLPRRGGWRDARAGATFTDPPSPPPAHTPREADRARRSNSPHLPTHPPNPESNARLPRRLRTPEPVTDRPFTPTRTRHLCFHTRRETRRPISDKSRAESAPPFAVAMAPSGFEPFPLLPPPPVAAGRAAFLPASHLFFFQRNKHYTPEFPREKATPKYQSDPRSPPFTPPCPPASLPPESRSPT